MLQFLSAYWFIALGSLLVPVLIHWWNKRPPQVVRVGSIRWLQAAASQRARSRHFADWPLLLLRCLLLAAIVFFLCQPFWQERHQPGKTKLVLVAPALLQEPARSRVQDALDSLLQQQYVLHQFAPGFPLIPAEDWTRIKNGEIKIPLAAGATGYWALARQLAAAFPHVKDQVVFTPDLLAGFTGQRPVLSAPTSWVLIPLEKEYTWVQEAFYAGADSLKVVLGTSSSAGTAFRHYQFSLPAASQILQTQGSPRLLFTRQGARSQLATEGQPRPVQVKASPWTISIVYDPTRSRDMRYVQAALQALRLYTRLPLRVSVARSAAPLKPASNWIFWLSDAPLPPAVQAVLAKGGLLFRDAATPAKRLPPAAFLPTALTGPVPLFRQAAIPPGPGIASWQNQFGEPLLHFQAVGKGGIYAFASRFNLQWSALPQSTFFPELLASLLLPAPASLHDARTIAFEQVAPVVAASRRPTPETTSTLDLKYWFIGLAAGLFLLERIWSLKKGGPR